MGSFLRPRRRAAGRPGQEGDPGTGGGATGGGDGTRGGGAGGGTAGGGTTGGGTAGGGTAGGFGGAGVAEAAVGTRPAARAVWVLAGLREPIVTILLAISFFTAISGKPVDGVLMLIVALSLGWDAAIRARAGNVGETAVAGRGRASAGHAGTAAGGLTGTGVTERGGAAGARAGTVGTAPGGAAGARAGTVGTAPGGAAGARAGTAGAGHAGTPPGRLRRTLIAAAVFAGGGAYAAGVGSFTRYSWPATAGIIGLGSAVVLAGWHGPLPRGPRRSRAAGDRLPATGTVLWGALFVVGCLWELMALLWQPTLTTDSYAHPTISTLTDPVLVSAAGRTSVLAAWLVIGWYLLRR